MRRTTAPWLVVLVWLLAIPAASQAQQSALTCAELGWSVSGGLDDTVCGSTGPTCSGSVDYAAAVNHCESLGARLCTQTELMNDETAGTGCGYDAQRLWSSTACGGGHMSLAGSSANLGTYPAQCTADATVLAGTRCCADVVAAAVPTSSVWGQMVMAVGLMATGVMVAGWRLATSRGFRREEQAL